MKAYIILFFLFIACSTQKKNLINNIPFDCSKLELITIKALEENNVYTIITNNINSLELAKTIIDNHNITIITSKNHIHNSDSLIQYLHSMNINILLTEYKLEYDFFVKLKNEHLMIKKNNQCMIQKNDNSIQIPTDLMPLAKLQFSSNIEIKRDIENYEQLGLYGNDRNKSINANKELKQTFEKLNQNFEKNILKK